MHFGRMFSRHFDAFKLNCGPCKISGPKRHLNTMAEGKTIDTTQADLGRNFRQMPLCPRVRAEKLTDCCLVGNGTDDDARSACPTKSLPRPRPSRRFARKSRWQSPSRGARERERRRHRPTDCLSAAAVICNHAISIFRHNLSREEGKCLGKKSATGWSLGKNGTGAYGDGQPRITDGRPVVSPL